MLKTGIATNNSLATRKLRFYNSLLVKIRSLQKTEYIRVGLLDEDGFAYSKKIAVTPEWQYVILPLDELEASNTILSRAYPKFLPANIDPLHNKTWDGNLNLIQGLQFVIDAEDYPGGAEGWHEVWVEEVSLLRR